MIPPKGKFSLAFLRATVWAMLLFFGASVIAHVLGHNKVAWAIRSAMYIELVLSIWTVIYLENNHLKLIIQKHIWPKIREAKGFSSLRIACLVLAFLFVYYFIEFYFQKKDTSMVITITAYMFLLIWILMKKNISGFSNPLSYSQVLEKASFLFALQYVMPFIIFPAMYFRFIETQSMDHWDYYLWDIPKLIGEFFAVGIIEEGTKAAIFFALLTLLKKMKNNAILVAAVITALIFGSLHYFKWGYLCIIPIFISSIPDMFFLIYYKDIRILIFTHFFHNLFVSSFFIKDFQYLPLILFIPAAYFVAKSIHLLFINRLEKQYRNEYMKSEGNI